jgi:hypothetical protein
MAKFIDLGSAKPDSPIYTGGVQVFSHPVSKPSSSGSAGKKGGAKPAPSSRPKQK